MNEIFHSYVKHRKREKKIIVDNNLIQANSNRKLRTYLRLLKEVAGVNISVSLCSIPK